MGKLLKCHLKEKTCKKLANGQDSDYSEKKMAQGFICPYTGTFVYILNKKLRKICSSAYCNKSSKELEIQTLVCYKVSFYLSNEVSFELVASAVAWKKQCVS